MACCGECTRSSGLLVNWAAVGMSVVDFGSVLWLNMDHLHLRVEDLRIRLFKGLLPFVASAALNEKTVDVNTILWSLVGINLGLVKDLEVHVDLIDSDDIFSSVVLL